MNPMTYGIRKSTFKKNPPNEKNLRSPFIRVRKMLRFFNTWRQNLKTGQNPPDGMGN